MTESSDKNRTYYKYLPIIIIGFAILSQSVNGIYATYDMTPPGAFEFLSYLGLFWLVGDWFSRDSKEYKIASSLFQVGKRKSSLPAMI